MGRIFLASPHMSDEGYEKKYVNKAFDTNWVSTVGENITEFEKEICDYVGINSSAALSSGTAAIHLALKLSNIQQGDVVFCQSLTFSASANPITYQGATPVFIDSDDKTWNMSPYALEKAFEKYPNAKAVIAVNLYGFSNDFDKIIGICQKNNAVLIEDAAESLGSKYKEKYTGTFGKYGIYSFNGNKIITTSSGGMLVANDGKAIEKAKFWATQARENTKHYEHEDIGYNYRMSNILAGIGRGQLKVLNKRIKKKKYIYEFYKKELAFTDEISFMPVNEWDKPNYWLTAILLKGKVRPLEILNALEAQDIEARPIWKPMHLQPVFAHCDYVGGETSEYIYNNGLCLPSDTKMSDDDLMRICGIIKELWKSV